MVTEAYKGHAYLFALPQNEIIGTKQKAKIIFVHVVLLENFTV